METRVPIKQEIRKEVLAKRLMLSEQEVFIKSEKICKNLLRMEAYCQADVLLLYAPIRKEVQVDKIFQDGIKKGKRIYFPKVLDKETMNFYQIDNPAELREGCMGIMEPLPSVDKQFFYSQVVEKEQKKTFMLMPGVAFSKSGFRIGYGGGYYDRYLQDKPLMIKAALCYEMQMVSTLSHDTHDIKADCVITENNIFYTSKMEEAYV